MTRIILPTGPTDSPPLALVGEAPGREEERRGAPFVGPSGFLLDQMLSAAGISRAQCYLTNVSNVRPPNNNFGMFYSDKSKNSPTLELIAHRKRLWAEMKAVNPKVIVAFGAEALKALAGRDKIGYERGKMIEVDLSDETAIRVLPTYHPAYVMRVYGERPVVELDLKKAYRQALKPFVPEMEFQIDSTLDEILDWFDRRLSPVSFDIETLGPCTRTLGFGWSPTEAISIPLISRGGHAWSAEDETLILQRLNTYLADPQIEKYIQNAPFDCTMIARELGFHVDGITLDTMYAHHLLYPELPKSLDFLSSIHTDFHLYWGKDKFATDESNARYNCYDCCATWISARAISRELAERHLLRFYNTRVHPVIFALTRMQNRGIRIDEPTKAIVRTETEAKLEAAKKVLATELGFELNPNSPKQVKELVYDRWNLPVQRKPNTKTITTDDNALRALSRKFPVRSSVLNSILLCRQTRKLISSYIDAKLFNGRALTSYGITVSGRITSGKTWDGYGGNLQNIPRGSFRRLYISDPGKTLIISDLKQAEYMVFVWDAPVHQLIHEYTTNPHFDVHRMNASLIYQIPEAGVSKEQRYTAKQGVYAGNYKIGALKMSRMYDMEFRQAKLILERYRAVRPELTLWWSKIEEQIKTTRTLTNPLGRQRIFFGRIDHELFRKAYNHYCQSTVADIINEAVVTLDAQGIEILLQVHDELVIQCDNADLYETIEIVRAAMEIPVSFSETDVPMVIPAEISYGPNWFEVKEYSNASSGN